MALLSRNRRPALLAAVMLVAFVLASECALRLHGFAYPPAAEREVFWSPARDRELWEAGTYARDRREIWKPRPNAELPWAPGERLNSAGFRGPEIPLKRVKDTIRIAILGSNEALGVGLRREDTWPHLLGKAIEEKGQQVEILCAAVEDTTLRQGLERWRYSVREYRPDLVLCTFSGEMESRAAPCGCTDTSRIEFNCGHGFPDYRDRPGLVPSPLKQLRLTQSAALLNDVIAGDYWTWRVGKLNEQRLGPRADSFDTAGVRRVPWKEFCELVPTLAAEVEAEEAKLIFCPIPGERAVSGASASVRAYHHLQLETCRKAKLPFLSGLQLFERAIASGMRLDELFTNGRLAEAGHRHLCHELAKVILPRLWILAR